MSFTERQDIATRMSDRLDNFFHGIGFDLVKTGYEEIYPLAIRQKMRYLYNDQTVLFARFLPDRIALLNDKNIFYIEYKVCNTPIIYDSRVKYLNQLNNTTQLNKNNIGAIETAAFSNYKNLNMMGVRVMVIVSSSFHNRKLVAQWIDQIRSVNQDKVVYGSANASRTPYTNINLDEFLTMEDILKPLNIPDDLILNNKHHLDGIAD